MGSERSKEEEERYLRVSHNEKTVKLEVTRKMDVVKQYPEL